MWGGHTNKCSFNQLVHFIEIMAEEGYRFAITNGLVDLPHRRCRNDASAPLRSDETVIFGSVPASTSSFEQVLQLLRPFHMGSWLLLALGLAVLIIIRLAIGAKYHWFREARTRPALMMSANSGEDSGFVEQLNDSERADLRFAMTLFRTSTVAMCAIVALFYEVAVVNFLFQRRNSTVSIEDISKNEHAKFAVPSATALENVWENEGMTSNWLLLFLTVQQVWRREIAHRKKPWAECESMEECFQWMSSGKVRYVVSFETRGRYILSQTGACGTFPYIHVVQLLDLRKEKDLGTVSMFETTRQLYTFNTMWFYNERCNRARKRQVDREILSLRMNGKSNELPVVIDSTFVDEVNICRILGRKQMCKRAQGGHSASYAFDPHDDIRFSFAPGSGANPLQTAQEAYRRK
ncbi:hypothetical protein FGB62_104g038 [Gracilaria domingensis]|nr:hypothetical protein FGB62_104g038 [Gracilaria domingensis]